MGNQKVPAREGLGAGSPVGTGTGSMALSCPASLLPPSMSGALGDRAGPGSLGKTGQIVSRALFPGSWPGPHSSQQCYQQEGAEAPGPQLAGPGVLLPVAGRSPRRPPAHCGFVHPKRQSRLSCHGVRRDVRLLGLLEKERAQTQWGLVTGSQALGGRQHPWLPWAWVGFSASLGPTCKKR